MEETLQGHQPLDHDFRLRRKKNSHEWPGVKAFTNVSQRVLPLVFSALLVRNVACLWAYLLRLPLIDEPTFGLVMS